MSCGNAKKVAYFERVTTLGAGHSLGVIFRERDHFGNSHGCSTPSGYNGIALRLQTTGSKRELKDRLLQQFGTEEEIVDRCRRTEALNG